MRGARNSIFFYRHFFILPWLDDRSAYFLFCADERPRVKAADSSLSLGDTAKELGRRWGIVDANTKKKYEAAAGKDKERYERVKRDILSKCDFAPAIFFDFHLVFVEKHQISICIVSGEGCIQGRRIRRGGWRQEARRCQGKGRQQEGRPGVGGGI